MKALDDEVDIEAIFEEGTAIDDAMKEAFHEAVRKHIQAGQPLIVWRNGRVERVAPESLRDSQAAENAEP